MGEKVENCIVNNSFSNCNNSFEIAALSVIGDREEQQDCFACSLAEGAVLFVVCDGMGGHEGGGMASSVAAREMISAYNSEFPCTDPSGFLMENVKKTDKRISEFRKPNGEPMNCGSTMVAVLISDDQLYWCSVGDSRAYLLRNGEFVQFTKDQNYRTVLEEKLNANHISKEEYLKEMERGDALICYVGMGNLSLIDYNSSPLRVRPGDKILIATDGLYRTVSEDDIKSITDNFTTPDEAVHALENTAKRKARKKHMTRDNSTIAIIKIK